jgi:hypothetical protein
MSHSETREKLDKNRSDSSDADHSDLEVLKERLPRASKDK